MTQYAFSYRRQLIALSLIGLLALTILLLVQAQTFTGLTIPRPAASSDARSGATSVDPFAAAHPADRKFFADSYLRDMSVSSVLLEDVHPADRRFFASSYVSNRNANAILLEDVHPADRKFSIGHSD